MKKVISIIIGLLCVCATYAISYASPYKGSVSRHTTHTAYSSSMASMPTASMSSVNSVGSTSSRGIASSTSGMATIQPIRGIYTSASSIRGGVTADMTYNCIGGGPRKVSGPGVPEEDCHCYDNINNTTGEPGADGLCDQCDHEIGNCECDPCNCVPVEWDWSVLAFLSLLSFAYIAYKKRQKMSNFVKTVF